MKKYTPYLVPLIVLGVVFFLLYRWYANRGVEIDRTLLGEDVQIEELTPEEAQDLSGVSDVETVSLENQTDDEMTSGEIRYEMSPSETEGEDRVRFSVMAMLPEAPEGQAYYVYLKEMDGDAVRQAFMLRQSKGGYLGSAAIPADLLPLEVIVSTSQTEDAAEAEAVLRGQLAPEESGENAS